MRLQSKGQEHRQREWSVPWLSGDGQGQCPKAKNLYLWPASWPK